MVVVADLHIAHTADLDAAAIKAARALLDDVFAGEMTDDDWEHALGGVHALIWEGPALIGHASLIQRRLLYHGRALRAGYVEAVAVRADRQRRGHGATMMAALERVLRGAYDLGALGSTDEGAPFYAGARLAALAWAVVRADPGRRPANPRRRWRHLRVRTGGPAGPRRRAHLRLARRRRLVALTGPGGSAKKAITRSSAARVG